MGINKLGLDHVACACLLHAPDSYSAMVKVLLPPITVRRSLAKESLFIHAFYENKEDLEKEIVAIKRSLSFEGILWISWPKKSSGNQKDLDEQAVRAIGLEAGLVDVKIAAIDAVWSGLKFVYRVKDRVK